MRFRRVIIWGTTLAVVVVGGLLPALQPAHSSDSAPQPSVLRVACNVLYWMQSLLPSGTGDPLKVGIGIISLILWGVLPASIAIGVVALFEKSSPNQVPQATGNVRDGE